MTSSLVPPGLRAVVADHLPDPGMPSGTQWAERLPLLVGELLRHWSLSVAGAPRHGKAALVLPVVRDDGTAAALKVVWPHREARHERQALALWEGRHAVRLLAADPSRWGLLLERLDPDRDLDGLPVLPSAAEVGALLRALDRPAPAWADRLSEHLAGLVADVDAALRDPGAVRRFPRRLLQHGRSLAADLAAEPGVDARLLHMDLHGQNVLWRPDPGQWVAIDPQALAADPAFGAAPVLWNRWDDVLAAPNARAHLELRVEVLSDAAGVDADRARAYAIVRMVRTALWALQAPGPGTGVQLTRAVTIIKAMQPA